MGILRDFNYKEKIDVVQLTSVPDGYGGQTYTEEIIDSIYARVDKLIFEFREQAHLYYVDKGITFTTIHRLQQGTDIRYIINDVVYKLVKMAVQRRKYVYVCEEVVAWLMLR